MLLVEDGSGVPNSDSYGDKNDLEDLLISYGHGAYVDDRDDAGFETDARNAGLYLNYAWAWKGTRTYTAQSMSWPRTGVVDENGITIPADLIPSVVVLAQALLMPPQQHGPLDGGSGGPGDPNRAIIEERADDASVRYADGSASRQYPTVSRLLAHLTTSSTMGSFRQIQAQRG